MVHSAVYFSSTGHKRFTHLRAPSTLAVCFILQSAKRQLEDKLATIDREAEEARAKQEALKKALEVTGA